MAPAGTPVPVIRKLNDLVKTIVLDPETKQKIMTILGGEVVANSPEQFDSLIKSDMRKWGDVIRNSKVQFEE